MECACGLPVTQLDGRVRVRRCPAWNRVALQSLGRSRPVHRMHELSKCILLSYFSTIGYIGFNTLTLQRGTKTCFVPVLPCIQSVPLLGEQLVDHTLTTAFTGRKEDFLGLAFDWAPIT